MDSCSSSRPPSYTTPLCFAVDIGNVRVVEMLLKAGALVNPSLGRGDGGCPKNCPPLQCALDNTDLVLAALLVQHGARCDVKLKDDSYLIHHYCTQGNLPAVQFLLSHGVNINQLGGQRKHSPLQVAAVNGHANIMELLLVRGATIPNNPATPLIISSVFSGSVPAVKLLIDHGMSVNCHSSLNMTPLYVACSKSVEMVRTLLRAGANPNLGGEQYKPVCNLLPLHRRPVPDILDIVRELILYNANMNICTKDYVTQKKFTLMQRALTCGEASVVSILLQTGLVHTNGITDALFNTFRSKCHMRRDVVQLVLYHRCNPYTLGQLCRAAIRECFHDIRLIEALPLPPPLLDYLMLTELTQQ